MELYKRLAEELTVFVHSENLEKAKASAILLEMQLPMI
jgi:hypothetical protein